MGGSSKKAFLDGGKAVTLCAVIGLLIGAIARQALPVEAVSFSLILLPFLPVPVALMTARHGFMTGALAAIVIGSLCTTWVVMTGSSVGLLVFMFAGVSGVFAGIGFRINTVIYRMLLLLMLLYAGIILTWFGIYSITTGVGPVAAMRDFATSFAQEAGGFYESLGIVQGNSEESLSQVSDSALYSIPALLFIVTGLMAIGTVAFSRYVFRLVKQPFPRDIVFSELRLHFGFVYIFIASLALIMLSKALEGTASLWAETAGNNLMMVSTVLFFIQGLAIASWFLRRRQASGIMKVVVYVILGMLEGLLSVVSFVGIFDVFMDFRRRFSGEGGQGQGNPK